MTPDIILPDPYGYAKSREKDLDFSLPWDKIASLKYKTWNKFKIDIPLLRKRSEKRVKASKEFGIIQKSVDYLNKRRDDTKVTLNLKETEKEDAENKKISKELKLDKINKSVVVTNVDASLRAHANYLPKSSDHDKKWKEEFAQRKKEWVESLQKDPILEESLFIMDDLIKESLGKKLSLVK